MPEGHGRPRGGRGGRGRGEGGYTAPTQMIDEILMPGDDSYMPEFDGMQFDGSQVHFDLNEPVFGPSQAFMALGGTPPSGHVPVGSWEVPFMAPAILPTPPASPAPAEQPNEPAVRGRARRVPRRRGCGTGDHM
ncbi:hypothetical protein PIB30_023870 [Stylosanthes scabra]|uniref:Uncharacterized protein n=1 Tax=Stylosanthes scabra TaxID=79078 RepID=A0ABU6S9L8_9FABA|nr:hypothetical protein [Stylosanthes scabra]